MADDLLLWKSKINLLENSEKLLSSASRLGQAAKSFYERLAIFLAEGTDERQLAGESQKVGLSRAA
jgi:hypothetical protein